MTPPECGRNTRSCGSTSCSDLAPRSPFAGNRARDEGRIVANAIHKAGLGVVEPRKADKEEAGIIGHAALLKRKSIRIEDRQADDREVELVARGPDDRRNVCGSEIELAEQWGGKAVV